MPNTRMKWDVSLEAGIIIGMGEADWWKLVTCLSVETSQQERTGEGYRLYWSTTVYRAVLRSFYKGEVN